MVVTVLQLVELTLLVFCSKIHPVEGDGQKTATVLVVVWKIESDGAAPITMVKACVALGSVPLAAVIVPLNVLAVVGVPDITPVVGAIVSPVGRPDAEKVIGAVPVAVTVKLYTAPTVPVAVGGALVIFGAVLAVG